MQANSPTSKLSGKIALVTGGTSVLSPKYEVFCCDQNGPPARRYEPDWRMEGAYLNRYVTDEQRTRRPIFIAPLWAGASWLFFRVARSTRMTKIWALLRQSGSDRLEKQPTELRQNTSYFGDRTLASQNRISLFFVIQLIRLSPGPLRSFADPID